MAAIFYNFAYFLMLADWFYNVYGLTDQQIDNLGALDMLMNMFFIYNSILHSGIVIVNNVIIFKEIELEFYQLVKGNMSAEYALSIDLAYESLNEDLWFFNPLKVFDRIYFFFTGYHSIDLIEENPDDRGGYIPNQINKEAYEYVYPITDEYTIPITNGIKNEILNIEDSLGLYSKDAVNSETMEEIEHMKKLI